MYCFILIKREALTKFRHRLDFKKIQKKNRKIFISPSGQTRMDFEWRHWGSVSIQSEPFQKLT